MSEETIEAKLTALEAKVDAIFISVEKTRKYFLWTLIITIGMIVLPLLILPLILPMFLSSLGMGLI